MSQNPHGSQSTDKRSFAVRFIQSATGQGLLLGLFLGPVGFLGALLFSSTSRRRSRTAAAALGLMAFATVALAALVLAVMWASQFD